MRFFAKKLLVCYYINWLSYDHPLLDNNGKIDSVMRVNYDIDMEVWKTLSTMTVGQLKDRMNFILIVVVRYLFTYKDLLKSDAEEISRVGRGLTGVMVAAVCKLMDIHELICVPKRLNFPTKARSTLGALGLSCRNKFPIHIRNTIIQIATKSSDRQCERNNTVDVFLMHN